MGVNLPSAAPTPAWKGQYRRLSLIVALPGLCLLVAGQVILTKPDWAAPFVSKVLGRFGPVASSFMMETFARGVALGLGLLLIGALLVALVIGLPEPERAQPHATDAGSRPSHRVPYLAFGCAGLAAAATLLSVVLLSREKPAMAALIVWLSALVVVFVLVCALDRQRHSHLGNPFRYRGEWAFLLCLVAVDLLFVGHDLTHYRWAGLPDESWFFVTAKDIAEGRLRLFPLSEEGVFGYHPILSSYYQAAFMKVFGVNIFGWRLSSAAALAVSLPFLYLFTREIWSPRAGWIAAVWFGTAPVAVGFAHLGYNNVQVYPVMLASLGILAWSIRRRSLMGHYVAGTIAGLGFYTFYPARLMPFLAVLVVWSYRRLSFKRPGGELWALVIGILLAVLPVVTHPAKLLTHMLRQTAFGSGGAPGSPEWQGHVALMLPRPDSLLKVWRDWLQSIFSAVWSKSSWNFGWSPVADPIVAALFVLGLWLGVLALVRRSKARLVLPTYLLAAFVVGAISQYSTPPLTRLLTLVPFTAMLAAISLDQTMTRLAQVLRWQGPLWVAAVGLIIAPVIWNVTALHHSMYEVHYGYGQGTTSELIRLARGLPDNAKLVYVQYAENDMYDVDYILEEYRLGDRTTYIRPYGKEALAALDEMSPPFAVVYDLKDRDEVQQVEATIGRRFPKIRWHDSAPGRLWNLRYCSVPDGLLAAP